MSENEIIPIDQILPNKLPVIALVGRPIFPGIFTPIMIANPPDMQIIEQAMAADGMLGLVLAREEADAYNSENLYPIGTAAKIMKRINLPDGGVNIFISTLKRFRIKKFLSKEAPVVVAVTYLDDVNDECGTSFSSEDFDTLGGYVFGLFGRQPEQGESIEHGGWRFTVSETDGRRIIKVMIESRAPEDLIEQLMPV